MSPDRMDDLLEQTLDVGRVPEDVTAKERAELERMLSVAGVLRAERAAVDDEARSAEPVARARFERAIGATVVQNPGVPSAGPRPYRVAFGFGAIAAVVAVLVVTVITFRPFGGVETAAALSVDDYVQLPGVITGTGEGTVSVTSAEFGVMEVLVSDLTQVMSGGEAAEPGALRAGDSVLVSGLVRRGGNANVQIDARTLALQGRGFEAPGPGRLDLRPNLADGAAGSVTAVVLSGDGSTAKVVVMTAAGRSVLVHVSVDSLRELIEAGSPVGSNVRLQPRGEGPRGIFDVRADAPGQEPPAHEGLVTIRGVIEERRVNVFDVRTERGLVAAVIRPHSQILLGESGLTLDSVRRGERLIGHSVSMTGGLEPRTGRLIIDVMVVGPKAGNESAP